MKDLMMTIVPEWIGKVAYFALGFMVCFALVVKGIV
jgi:hypothetical protein